MARLMWICGILLVAAGVALGVVLLVAKEPVPISVDTAVILLVGGILSLGLGGVIDALRSGPRIAAVAETVRAAVEPVPEPEAETSQAEAAIPEFGPRGAKAAAAAVAEANAADAEEISRPTRETISALEQARLKIEQALEAKRAVREEQRPATAPVEEVVEEATDEAVVEDGQLYVVEERVIRRHPARVLSDGTVEAETAEGWMRFENLEHLDEYLDAMEEAR